MALDPDRIRFKAKLIAAAIRKGGSVDSNPVSLAHLSPGQTVYLFAVRQPAGKGFKMQYRTVSQFEEFRAP